MEQAHHRVCRRAGTLGGPIAQRDVLSDLARAAFEDVQGLFADNPKCPVAFLEAGSQHCSHIVQVTRLISRRRVDPGQSVGGGYPDHSGTVLTNVMDWALQGGRVGGIVGERLQYRIVSVNRQTRRHP